MKKFFKSKFLNWSFWIVLILAYIVPTDEKYFYGYPSKFFRIDPHQFTQDTLIFNSEFMILPFLGNVINIFILLNLVYNIYINIKHFLKNKIKKLR